MCSGAERLATLHRLAGAAVCATVGSAVGATVCSTISAVVGATVCSAIGATVCAVVTGGPPPKPLAQLPIRQDGERLVVAGYFLTPPYPYHNNEAEWNNLKQEVEEALT